jgi:hypothetical protein
MSNASWIAPLPCLLFLALMVVDSQGRVSYVQKEYHLKHPAEELNVDHDNFKIVSDFFGQLVSVTTTQSTLFHRTCTKQISRPFWTYPDIHLIP